jgi:hypothetical protein
MRPPRRMTAEEKAFKGMIDALADRPKLDIPHDHTTPNQAARLNLSN